MSLFLRALYDNFFDFSDYSTFEISYALIMIHCLIIKIVNYLLYVIFSSLPEYMLISREGDDRHRMF
jgi:ABC-type uncharacterized transport system YnjBCD permease subunit